MQARKLSLALLLVFIVALTISTVVTTDIPTQQLSGSSDSGSSQVSRLEDAVANEKTKLQSARDDSVSALEEFRSARKELKQANVVVKKVAQLKSKISSFDRQAKLAARRASQSKLAENKLKTRLATLLSSGQLQDTQAATLDQARERALALSHKLTAQLANDANPEKLEEQLSTDQLRRARELKNSARSKQLAATLDHQAAQLLATSVHSKEVTKNTKRARLAVARAKDEEGNAQSLMEKALKKKKSALLRQRKAVLQNVKAMRLATQVKQVQHTINTDQHTMAEDKILKTQATPREKRDEAGAELVHLKLDLPDLHKKLKSLEKMDSAAHKKAVKMAAVSKQYLSAASKAILNAKKAETLAKSHLRAAQQKLHASENAGDALLFAKTTAAEDKKRAKALLTQSRKDIHTATSLRTKSAQLMQTIFQQKSQRKADRTKLNEAQDAVSDDTSRAITDDIRGQADARQAKALARLLHTKEVAELAAKNEQEEALKHAQKLKSPFDEEEAKLQYQLPPAKKRYELAETRATVAFDTIAQLKSKISQLEQQKATAVTLEQKQRAMLKEVAAEKRKARLLADKARKLKEESTKTALQATDLLKKDQTP